MASIDQIKQLREETAVSVQDCKKAVEQSGGDLQKAKELLKKWGRDLAVKKAGRGAEQGVIKGVAGFVHDKVAENRHPEEKKVSHEIQNLMADELVCEAKAVRIEHPVVVKNDDVVQGASLGKTVLLQGFYIF